MPSEWACGRKVRRCAYRSVNWRQPVVGGMLGLSLLCGSGTVRAQAASGSTEVIDALFQVQRSGATDQVWLRNGERLKGIVRNEVFTLRTAHGPVALETRRIAGVELAAGRRPLDTVHGVNHDRISGFIEEPHLDVQLADGSRLNLRREAVQCVLFRARPGELDDLPRRQSIGLKNGDSLTG